MTDDMNAPAPDDATAFSYEAFGREFFKHAVTRDRIERALSNLAGNSIDFGPRSVGPAGLARISATGNVGNASVIEETGDLIRFKVTIPIRLQLDVRLAGQNHRFNAHIEALLRLTVRALRPLRIFIDVAEPSERDVTVDVEAQGLRASVLNIVADVEGELRRYVARYIARQIDEPEIRDRRDIDVAARLGKRWSD